ncbi:MAG: FAD-binding oxidoreductase [Myxococcales bacterium]|nr:FAD-binding oxidoreductase [Myxococcales bacterium]
MTGHDTQAMGRHAAALSGAVGADHVTVAGERLTVVPGAAGEVIEAVRLARAARLPIRFGGALSTDGASVSCDFGRMTQMLHLDETSLLVHVQAGITLGALEERLGARALTLGAAARRSLDRRVGAALAAPRPEEACPRGRFLEACAAIDGVLLDGTALHTRMAPRRATGPDLSHALLGARGTTGAITGAWLRVLRRPPVTRFVGAAFGEGKAAIAVACALLDRGIRPADLSIADGALAAGEIGGGALADRETVLALRLDGMADPVAAEEALAVEQAASAGGRPVSSPLIEAWLTSLTASAELSRREPRLTSRPHRRHATFIPWCDLAAAFAAAGPRAELSALTPAGGALSSDAPITPRPDPLAIWRAALAHALDEGGSLPEPRTR